MVCGTRWWEMTRKVSPESVALVAALLLVGAFLVSFARGIVWPGARASAPAEDTEEAVVDPGTIRRGRIDVRNASDVPGVARDVMARLRDAGFDVVNYGNAEKTPDSSAVIDRVGGGAVAKAVAAELGIERITTQIDSTLFIDATVILGVDWNPGRR